MSQEIMQLKKDLKAFCNWGKSEFNELDAILSTPFPDVNHVCAALGKKGLPDPETAGPLIWEYLVNHPTGVNTNNNTPNTHFKQLTLVGRWVAIMDAGPVTLAEVEGRNLFRHFYVESRDASSGVCKVETELKSVKLPSCPGEEEWYIKKPASGFKFTMTPVSEQPEGGGSGAGFSLASKELLFEPGLLYFSLRSKMSPAETTAYGEGLKTIGQPCLEQIELTSTTKTTLLYSATRCNNHSATALLLQHGASPKEEGWQGNTAAHVAFYNGNVASFDALSWGSTPVCRTWRNDADECVDKLVKKSVSAAAGAALHCSIREDQWYVLNGSSCAWEAAPEQKKWSDEFTKDPKAKFAISHEGQRIQIDFESCTATSPGGTAVPIMRWKRSAGKIGCATYESPCSSSSVAAWSSGARDRTLPAVVDDTKLYFKLEADYGEQVKNGAVEAHIVDVGRKSYRRYRPTWFHRQHGVAEVSTASTTTGGGSGDGSEAATNNFFGWMPVDHVTAKNLTRARKEGKTTYEGHNRTFNVQSMTAFDKKDQSPTQLVHIETLESDDKGREDSKSPLKF